MVRSFLNSTCIATLGCELNKASVLRLMALTP